MSSDFIRFIEDRGAQDAERYIRSIGAHKNARVAQKAYDNQDYHVSYGVWMYSVDFAFQANGKERCIYKAVFGRTFRDLLWEIAEDLILENEKRMFLMEYYADF
jgi:hypothetical protein